jgi:FixJ family two-component response regulator
MTGESHVTFVAVVDDDEHLRTAVADLIASYGIEARGFGTSREYLDSASVASTGCLIADVQMAGMSGLELHKALLGRGYHIPVIFITAFYDERMRREAESLGAFGFLRKPFDIGMLMVCINSALAQRQAAVK